MHRPAQLLFDSEVKFFLFFLKIVFLLNVSGAMIPVLVLFSHVCLLWQRTRHWNSIEYALKM